MALLKPEGLDGSVTLIITETKLGEQAKFGVNIQQGWMGPFRLLCEALALVIYVGFLFHSV